RAPRAAGSSSTTPATRGCGDASGAEDEVDGAEEAEAGPEEVELHLLLHVEDGEGDEHHERDHLLHHLELRERERGVADPVGGHLEEVLEQGDPPRDEGGHDPRLRREVPEVGVPRERHEDVRGGEEEGGLEPDGHGGAGGPPAAKTAPKLPPPEPPRYRRAVTPRTADAARRSAPSARLGGGRGPPGSGSPRRRRSRGRSRGRRRGSR